nr:PREDICTED: patched domain-containing protein 3-like [Linepithema humile]
MEARRVSRPTAVTTVADEERGVPGVTWSRCKELLLDFHFNVDRIFYRIGYSIATKPWIWLTTCVCLNLVCGFGLLLWREEVDDIELFMPVGSIFRKDAAWVKEHFRDDLRHESILITAPNVLDPKVLRSIRDIEKDVKSIVVNNNSWEDVCAGHFTWFQENDKWETMNKTEFPEEYLPLINDTMMKEPCVQKSLLKLWQKDGGKDIDNLTKLEILEDITATMQHTNAKNILSDIAPLLAGVEYEENGQVRSAKATILYWVLKKSNPHSPEWEVEFINRVLHSNRTLPTGMEIYAVTLRSYDDMLHEVVNSNMTVLFCGMSLISIYVIVMISRCNAMQQRIYLSLMGICVVGQALLSSYGLCFYMGFMYGPVHAILPFLLLGIGVDDMFVIMQSLETLLCINIWAIFQLQQNFDALMYLNQESYPIQFNNKLMKYFPRYGKNVNIYLTGVDYYEDREALFQLVENLRRDPYVNNHTLDPWFVAYEKWLNITGKAQYIEDKDEYYNILTEYLLFSVKGQAYIQDIKFSKLPFNDYNITTSQIPVQHIPISTTSDQIRAMQAIRDAVKSVNFTYGHDYIAIHSTDLIRWATNKIIGEELIRNLSLEILAVGMVTLVFLRNLIASFWVMCCVLFTLINLLGSMYFLGLTVEVSSSITILLCAGLAVDYAAHIGLEFIRSSGSKQERALTTFSVIGPAVLNGGLSTFLAFVLLGFSRAYIFMTFFKLFSSVILFGLFHGLLFLPVILSLAGPGERKSKSKQKNQIMQYQNGYYSVHQNGKDIEDTLAK